MGRAQFRVLFSMIAAIGMVAMALPVQAGKIFWMEPIDLAGPPSKIFRADLDGSNQELVLWIDAEFVSRLMLPLSLSYDHRVIDGADAVRFTTRLCELLADVRSLVL